ncbi:zonular occludens toxin domain-containing protein [Sphingomonas sp. DT-204]|uniref:zonular occludens toxin domain-containing protein n=1 Tax=Sphingomonas sp. DT-204 TaxID=3396166 RepID=UPI003F1C6038
MQTFTGYFGVQGSGKSFEIVKNVIVPALRDTNRRVVANIDGLNADAISEFLGKDVRDRIVLYDDEDIVKPGFIPTAREVDDAFSEATVQPGDLLIVDEAARYFGTTKKPPEHVIDFIRMARHYTDDNGMPCNIVIAAQALTMIHKDLRSMLSTVTKCRKHIDVGKPDRYVVHVYAGDRPIRDALSSVHQEKYDPEIFPLYKSHAGGAGQEVMVDDRVNFMKGGQFKRLKMGIAISAIIALTCCFMAWRWFSRIQEEAKAPGKAQFAATASSGVGQPPVTKSSSSTKRRILGTVLGRDGREYLMLDTPEGVVVRLADSAIHTEMGVFLDADGISYSSLAPVEPDAGGKRAGASILGN